MKHPKLHYKFSNFHRKAFYIYKLGKNKKVPYNKEELKKLFLENKARKGGNSIENQEKHIREFEKALYASKDGLLSILNATTDAIVMTDHAGKIVLWNKSAEKIFNYSQEEALSREIHELILPRRFRAKFEAYLPQFRETGEAPIIGKIIENTALKKDRTEIPIEVSTTSVKIADKWYAIAIIRDISERREMKKALEESVNRLQAVLSALPDLIFILDKKGCFVDYYAKQKEDLYVKPLDFLNKRIHDVLPEDVAENAMNALREAISSNRVVSFEYSLEMPEGVRYWEGHFIHLNKEKVLLISREITNLKLSELKLKKAYSQLQKVLEGVVRAFARLIEQRDPYTAGHQERVARLSCAIGRELGLDEQKIQGINVSALLHDIGKISVPIEILTKPAKLTDLEFTMIKQHPEVAYTILKNIDFPWPVAEIVYQHHERLDGSGYPRGLTRKEILLEAKIIAVADVVEAMFSHRPYRPAYTLDEALHEVFRHKGNLYDPDAVNAAIRLFREKKFTF